VRFEELLDLTAQCLQLHPRTGGAVANAGLAARRITADLKEANGHGTDATAVQCLRMAWPQWPQWPQWPKGMLHIVGPDDVDIKPDDVDIKLA
jgi:hypothetical protein